MTNGVSMKNPAFIHPTALMYGNISLAEGVSLWPNSVIRADMNNVSIGEKTNIQDFVMIHVGLNHETHVGSHCSITHHCTIHGCTIGDNCLIGINATIMDGCVIGDNCIVAGHTYISEGTIIPDNSIVAGIPGKVIKEKNNGVANMINALGYYENAIGFSKDEYHRLKDPVVLKKIMEEVKKISS